MTDPANPEEAQTPIEAPQPIQGGSSSTDPTSDDFAASITEAQPYDYNPTSENSVERDEEGPVDNILKK